MGDGQVDLGRRIGLDDREGRARRLARKPARLQHRTRQRRLARAKLTRQQGDRGGARSEEHTSELQSPMRNSYAVFCLKQKIKPAQRRVQATYKATHNKSRMTESTQ